jgi:hypothetical protein
MWALSGSERRPEGEEFQGSFGPYERMYQPYISASGPDGVAYVHNGGSKNLKVVTVLLLIHDCNGVFQNLKNCDGTDPNNPKDQGHGVTE